MKTTETNPGQGSCNCGVDQTQANQPPRQD